MNDEQLEQVEAEVKGIIEGFTLEQIQELIFTLKEYIKEITKEEK